MSLRATSSYSVPRLAPSGPAGLGDGGQKTGARIVWIIFDEWDAALTFERRDPGLRLPAIDAFRSVALDASAAQPPGKDTLPSVPGLLLGQPVEAVRAVDIGDLAIRLAGASHEIRFQQLPNVIQRLAQRSLSIGVAGWYIPYCRLFDGLLSACTWSPAKEYLDLDRSLPGLVARQLTLLFLPGVVRAKIGFMTEEEPHRKIYSAIEPSAERYAGNPALDFVFLHLPIPHEPVIFNMATGQLGADRIHPVYADNLALADQTLGRIRAAMEATGTWDDTTVLLSSDHWFRYTAHPASDRFNRVPFLLKLKGQHLGVRYDLPFNTVVTGSLLLSIVDGKVQTPEDAVRWLNEHRDSPQHM
jgi:hypothetical protein